MSDFTDRIAALEDRLANLTLGDLPLAALQRKLENDWQPDAAVLLQPNSISSDQLQAGILPVVGTVTVTMAALAAGGTAIGTASGLPFGSKPPSRVIAQATTGGSGYFSNQYVIGTDTYTANGFNILVGSGGIAFAAGWTLAVNYIAYF
ncbi:MAG: hypothetical protein ACXVGC_12640 [Mycobacteriaceae bacterium]